VPRKTYRFLYLPEDHKASKELKVPRMLVVLSGGAVLALVVLSFFYVLGLFQGTSWIPGGSRLQKENASLAAQIVHLGDKVDVLRDNLSESYRLQEIVSVAMGLDPLDPNVREAGVGGRGELLMGQERELPGGTLSAVTLDGDLNALLRQARIQHEGYRALIDTLSLRTETLVHLPSIRPVDVGWMSSSYGYRDDPFTGRKRFHRGLDYSVPSGTPIRATADGTVVAVKRDRGLGMMIRLDHGNRMTTTYAHMSEWRVRQGQKVTRGQTIGLSGNTGRSTAPHLHYEVKVNGRHTNPMPYILDSYVNR
jgi:murein DD-endopeptidase MepM/ murein hydrolase activator NlpD